MPFWFWFAIIVIMFIGAGIVSRIAFRQYFAEKRRHLRAMLESDVKDD